MFRSLTPFPTNTPETVNVFDDFSHKAGSYKVAAVDFDIACEELIKANGWTVLAKVEHGTREMS